MYRVTEKWDCIKWHEVEVLGEISLQFDMLDQHQLLGYFDLGVSIT